MALIRTPDRFHETVFRRLKEDEIQKTFFDLPHGGVGVGGGAIRGLAYKYFYGPTNPHHFFVARGKHLLKLEIPPPPPVVKKGVFEVKLPFRVFAGHTVDAGGVRLSPAGDWLLAFGSDGFVSLREVDAMEPPEEEGEGEGEESGGGGGRKAAGACQKLTEHHHQLLLMDP